MALDIGICAQEFILASKAARLLALESLSNEQVCIRPLEFPASDQVMISIVFGYGEDEPPMPERIKDNIFQIRARVTSGSNNILLH